MKVVITGVNAYGAITTEEFNQVDKDVTSKLLPSSIDIFNEEDEGFAIHFDYGSKEEEIPFPLEEPIE